ncbi:alpha/beta hydrolase [Shewanella waksmanii]|uniref:alpha/beta hydrolase n=1 Tax=Shewanella waksmanii TaxID=213783 RepID=UPI003736B003
MKTFVIGSTKHLLVAAIYIALGGLLTLIVTAVMFLNARPDLNIWHSTLLENQFQHDKGITSFNEYLANEQRLFSEVEQRIYAHTTLAEHSPITRYVRGSLSDPKHWQTPWNRSFEWPNSQARYGVLLLHGMSDSPYAMSHLAEHFRSQAHVVGLRLPGHGTLPSGLVNLAWQDLASAVALATEHLNEQLNGKPIFVIGFSTGAALALNHELTLISRDQQPSYSAMVFISPAIGLPPVAAGAKWQANLGRLLSLDKLLWNSIQTEYDPFKYMSFAVNAGDVVYQLAQRNRQMLMSMSQDKLVQLPPTLTFQSLVDDTVSTGAVLNDFYQWLPQTVAHEYVMFDINRTQINMGLIPNDPLLPYRGLLDSESFAVDFTLVQNKPQPSLTTLLGIKPQDEVESVRFGPKGKVVTPLGLYWPDSVYSLSHVALPIPEADSLYGPSAEMDNPRVHIGAADSRGERGLLSVPANEILRQKWNPFYPYMIERIDQYFGNRSM